MAIKVSKEMYVWWFVRRAMPLVICLMKCTSGTSSGECGSAGLSDVMISFVC